MPQIERRRVNQPAPQPPSRRQRRRVHRLRALRRHQARARGRLRLRAPARRDLGLSRPARLRPLLFRAEGRQGEDRGRHLEDGLGRLKVKPEEGMEVIVQGRVTIFPRLLQISDRHREPGARRARRADGAARGAQAQVRRRRPVRRGAQEAAAVSAQLVGIVTSPTGAVIRDMLHGFAERFPTRVVVWPVRVQGERQRRRGRRRHPRLQRDAAGRPRCRAPTC